MQRTRLGRSLRVTFIGMAVNALLALVKLATGLIGHSHALFADGVESLADLVSSFIVWRGLVLAAEPADENHPYGHGKAEPIAAAMVAAMLLLAAVAIAVQAVEAMASPHEGPRAFTLVILIMVVMVKELLFRFVIREASSVESSAVRTDAWHHRSDAITSLAAAVGISVSLLGGRAYASADDVAALLAAGIIIWNGWKLLRPALDELMDTAPRPGVIKAIRDVAAAVEGVQLVEKCVVRKMGYQYYVDMHVEVDPAMSVRRAHEIAHNVKDAVRNSMPKVHDVLVHIEPGD